MANFCKISWGKNLYLPTSHCLLLSCFSLLVISQLLPDLLKLSPNNSFQSPQNTSSDAIKQEHTEQLTTLEDVEMTRMSSVWHQPTTALDSIHSSTSDKEKNYLIGTEIALARTIRNYNNKQRSPARKPTRKNQSFDNLPRMSVKHHANSVYKEDISQSKPPSSRPQSSSTQRKPPSKRISKSRTLSALHSTSYSNTAKDLELLTKSITQQLSIKNKNSPREHT